MRPGRQRIPNTGDYRQVVVIEQPPAATDTPGQPTGDWTPFLTWYCSDRPTGGVELYFDKEKQRFRSLDTKHTSQPFES